jgi:hypothetical protein
LLFDDPGLRRWFRDNLSSRADGSDRGSIQIAPWPSTLMPKSKLRGASLRTLIVYASSPRLA